MIIYLSLLVALIGLFMYVLCNRANPSTPRSDTIAEIGRIMFFCGLLAFLLMVAAGHKLIGIT
jgi:hypothetical protein